MKVALTVDVEAHRTIDEISGTSHDSLGGILRTFSAAAASGTFFVDVCESATWGEVFMKQTCERILSQVPAQSVELHIHPHHLTRDHSRWLLTEYNLEEKQSILSQSIEQFEALVGRKPRVFRAGGFGIDDAFIDLLRANAILIDSSFMRGHRACRLSPEQPDAITQYRGVIEIPVSPVRMKLAGRLRDMPLDFNWLPLPTMKAALTNAAANGAEQVVILLHSSSLCLRFGRRFVYWPPHERKLRQLLEFCRERGFQFESVEQCAASHNTAAPGASYETKNFLESYYILWYQSLVGCGTKRSFRLFLAGHFLAAALLLWILLTALVFA